MSEINLSQEQYAQVIRVIRKTRIDYTHALRLLNENAWDEEKASTQALKEKQDFADGKIKFGPNKEVI